LARISWHPDALTDIDDISSYIAQDSPRNAKLLTNRLFTATERLLRYPRSGRIAPELERDDVREVIVGDYRVIYRLLSYEIEVQHVIHGARLLRPEDLAQRETVG
jgi:toxin ParE1/3/4